MFEKIKSKLLEKGSDLKSENDFYFCPVGTEAIDMENDFYQKRYFGWIFKDAFKNIYIFSDLEMSKISEAYFMKIKYIPPSN